MEIVAEYKVKNATVMICSDCYKNLSQEQIDRNRKNAQNVAWEIVTKN